MGEGDQSRDGGQILIVFQLAEVASMQILPVGDLFQGQAEGLAAAADAAAYGAGHLAAHRRGGAGYEEVQGNIQALGHEEQPVEPRALELPTADGAIAQAECALDPVEGKALFPGEGFDSINQIGHVQSSCASCGDFKLNHFDGKIMRLQPGGYPGCDRFLCLRRCLCMLSK